MYAIRHSDEIFQTLDEQEVNGVCVPHNQIHSKLTGKFRFSAPTQIYIIGSFLSGTVIKPAKVDVALQIPNVSSIIHLQLHWTLIR